MNMADTPTPPAMPGQWVLFAPDGRCWVAESPLKCVKAEMDERVPPDVALARIMREAAAHVESDREQQFLEALESLLADSIGRIKPEAWTKARAAIAQAQQPKFCAYEHCDQEPARGSELCTAHIRENLRIATEERQRRAIVAVDHEGKPVYALSAAEFALCNPSRKESGNDNG